MNIALPRKRTFGLACILAAATCLVASGMFRLNAAIAESEQTEYLAFAMTAGNVGEVMTQPRAECRNVRAHMTILPSIVPALSPPIVVSDIEASIRSTDALCNSRTSYSTAIALRRLQTGRYAAAIAAFSDDFRSRFPTSFDGLQGLLFVGHPYLRATVTGVPVN